MGPPKFVAPGNCPICPPPLKPALLMTTKINSTIGITELMRQQQPTTN